MNKKIISIIFVLIFVLFIGINAKALNCSDYQSTGSKTTCYGGSGAEVDCSSPAAQTSKTTYYNNGCKSGATDCINSNGTCTCSTPSPTISVSCGVISSGGENSTCTAKAGGYDDNDTVEFSTSNTGIVTVDKSSGVITAKSISGDPCKRSFSVTVKVTNACGNSASASASAGEVMVPWSGTQPQKCYKEISQATAEKNGYSLYTPSCTSDEKKCGEKGTLCTIRTRSCGSAPPVPLPHCYDIGYGLLEWALKETVVNNKIQENMPKGWKIAKDDNGNELTKDQCYTQFKCSTKYPGSDTKESACNSTNEFTGDYVKKCGILKGSSVGDEFYRIDCKETMKTGFNGPILNDSAHPNSFMYPGTAFKFNYLAKTKVECEGKWNQDFYNAAEAYVKRYIDTKKLNSFHQEDSGFFGSALAGVQSVKDSYKNWTLNYFNSSMSKETGEIKDIQPTVKNTSKDEKSFTLEMADGSTAVVSSCGSEPNGKNANFTYKVAYTIKMQMPVVYYSDSKKPQYTTTASTGYESIGRVFPISDIKEYANRKDYKYAVTVSNLGLGHKWVNKETCVLGVKEKEIVFRSINLSDPFIQYLDSNHQIGENWKNNKYDFTGIIDKNTWSNPSQFNKVTINQQIGALIKNELASQYASYLGSCAKGTDQGRTPQLCALYKQAVAGKK